MRGRNHRVSDKGQGRPNREMDPHLGMPQLFHYQQQRNDNVSDHEDRKVGRRVIGLLVVQFGAARRAGSVDSQVAVEKCALATGRATLGEATQQALLPGSGGGESDMVPCRLFAWMWGSNKPALRPQRQSDTR